MARIVPAKTRDLIRERYIRERLLNGENVLGPEDTGLENAPTEINQPAPSYFGNTEIDYTDPNSPYTLNLKGAGEEGYADAFLKSAAGGASGLVSNALEHVALLPQPEYTRNVLRSGADYLDSYAKMRNSSKDYDLNEMIPFASDYYTNPQGFTSGLGNLVGSWAPLMAGGALLASASKATKLGQLAYKLGSGLASKSPLIHKAVTGNAGKFLAANLASTPLEVATESGGVARDLRQKGASLNEQRKGALINNAIQMPALLASNAVQGYLGGSMLFGGKVSGNMLKRAAVGTAKTGAEALSQPWEEGMQRGSTDYAKGEQPNGLFSVFNPLQWSEGQKQEATAAFIPSLVMGGAGAAAGGINNSLKDRRARQANNYYDWANTVNNGNGGVMDAEVVGERPYERPALGYNGGDGYEGGSPDGGPAGQGPTGPQKRAGGSIVDRVRDLEGKIPFYLKEMDPEKWGDRDTACMYTMGVALKGTPFEGQIDVDTAVATAEKEGLLVDGNSDYVPQAGDMAVVLDGDHMVMVTENGGTIQNGKSAGGVYESEQSPAQMFANSGGVKYYIRSSIYNDGVQDADLEQSLRDIYGEDYMHDFGLDENMNNVVPDSEAEVSTQEQEQMQGQEQPQAPIPSQPRSSVQPNTPANLPQVARRGVLPTAKPNRPPRALMSPTDSVLEGLTKGQAEAASNPIVQKVAEEATGGSTKAQYLLEALSPDVKAAVGAVNTTKNAEMLGGVNASPLPSIGYNNQPKGDTATATASATTPKAPTTPKAKKMFVPMEDRPAGTPLLTKPVPKGAKMDRKVLKEALHGGLLTALVSKALSGNAEAQASLKKVDPIYADSALQKIYGVDEESILNYYSQQEGESDNGKNAQKQQEGSKTGEHTNENAEPKQASKSKDTDSENKKPKSKDIKSAPADSAKGKATTALSDFVSSVGKIVDKFKNSNEKKAKAIEHLRAVRKRALEAGANSEAVEKKYDETVKHFDSLVSELTDEQVEQMTAAKTDFASSADKVINDLMWGHCTKPQAKERLQALRENVLEHGGNRDYIEKKYNEAMERVDRIVSKVTPEQAKARAEKSKAGIKGKETTVITDNGTEFKVRYKILRVDDVITSNIPTQDFSVNPEYPQELQPRNRENFMLKTQVANMAASIRPVDLAESRNLNTGAPIVNSSRVVENGNGRAMAIALAYKNSSNGNGYKDYLVENASKFGIKPSLISMIKAPILVRERIDNDVKLSEIINSTAGGATLGASEQANTDAKLIKPSTLQLYVENEKGDLTTGPNQEFLRDAIRDMTGGDPAKMNALYTQDGDVSQQGVSRVRNALFAKAYADKGLLAKMSESKDTNIANIIAAMVNASPLIANTKIKIDDGILYDINVNKPFADACKKLMALRKEGKSVEVYIREQTMFGEGLSPEARVILQFLDEQKRSSVKVRDFLVNCYRSIIALGDPNQVNIFGDSEPIPTAMEIIENNANRILGEENSYIKNAPEAPAPAPEPAPQAKPQATKAPKKKTEVKEFPSLEQSMSSLSALGLNKINTEPEKKAPKKEVQKAPKKEPKKETVKETVKEPKKKVKAKNEFSRPRFDYAWLEEAAQYSEEAEKKKAEKAKADTVAPFTDEEVDANMDEWLNLVKNKLDENDGTVHEDKETYGAESENTADERRKFDPELHSACFKIGIVMHSRGYEEYGPWSQKMKELIGDRISPWLASIYTTVEAYPPNTRVNEKAVSVITGYVGSLYEAGITKLADIKQHFKENYGEDAVKEYTPLLEASFAGVNEFKHPSKRFLEEEAREPEKAEKRLPKVGEVIKMEGRYYKVDKVSDFSMSGTNINPNDMEANFNIVGRPIDSDYEIVENPSDIKIDNAKKQDAEQEVEEPQEEPQEKPQAEPATKQSTREEVLEPRTFTRTDNKRVVPSVKIKGKLETKEFTALKRLAKLNNGIYSRYAKQFLFENEGDRDTFVKRGNLTLGIEDANKGGNVENDGQGRVGGEETLGSSKPNSTTIRNGAGRTGGNLEKGPTVGENKPASGKETSNNESDDGRKNISQGNSGKPDTNAQTSRTGESGLSGGPSGRVDEHSPENGPRAEENTNTVRSSGVDAGTGRAELPGNDGLSEGPQGNVGGRLHSDSGTENGTGVPTSLSGGEGSEPSGPKSVKKKQTNGEDYSILPNGNYHVNNLASLSGGTKKERFARNKAALEIVKEYQESGLRPTPEELHIMSMYSGWGSFRKELFGGTWEKPEYADNMEEENKWFREYIGSKEAWELAKESTLTAFFTPPEVLTSMWDMTRQLGFKGGKVLEPSMGVGGFYATMPEDLQDNSILTGVEYDTSTGAMATALYPNAHIFVQGYEKHIAPPKSYDLIIGNVPFGEYSIYEKKYNSKFNFDVKIHDFFFVKGIDQLKPNGIMIAITEHSTLDRTDERIRTELAKEAKLVGAVRLPNGAFNKSAGTQVLTDIIIFQKREKPLELTEALKEPWVKSVFVQTPELGRETGVFTSKYFVDAPKMIAGKMEYIEDGRFHNQVMHVEPPKNLGTKLEQITKMLPADIMNEQTEPLEDYKDADLARRENTVYVNDEGELVVRVGMEEVPTNKILPFKTEKQPAKIGNERKAQVVHLYNFHEAYKELRDAELGSSENVEEVRAKTLKIHDDYVKKWGPIVKSSDRLKQGYELPYAANYFVKMKDFTTAADLAALDMDGQPADILVKSLTVHKTQHTSPTVTNGFYDQRIDGKRVIDTQAIADKTGKTREEVERELIEKNLIFKTPTGEIVPADIYLSGNVVEKLKQAQASFDSGDKSMKRNIEALTKVRPKPVSSVSITSNIGASWVPTFEYAHCFANLLGYDTAEEIGLTVENKGGRYSVSIGDARAENSALATEELGTGRKPISKVFEAALNHQTIRITVRDDHNKVVTDEQATQAINLKVSQLNDKFNTWLWRTDEDRKTAMELIYNEVMNCYVAPHYDASFMEFVGMAKDITLRPHQANFVLRGETDGHGIAWHDAGTGKTFIMAVLSQELRRIGKANKVLINCYNANAKEIYDDYKKLYKFAKILYIPELSAGAANINATNRLLAQITTGDYDAIIIPHSVLDNKVAFDEETLMALKHDELEEIKQSVYDIATEEGDKNIDESCFELTEEDIAKFEEKKDKSKDKKKKKKSEKGEQPEKPRFMAERTRNALLRYKRLLNNIRELAAKLDEPGMIDFAKTGIDCIFVDEVQVYKKSPKTSTRQIKGLDLGSSKAGTLLSCVTDYIHAKRGDDTGVFTFSGTIVDNTIPELYSQMRYVAPNLMKEAGVYNLDDFLANFTEPVAEMEPTASGDNEMVERLTRFINIKEMQNIFSPVLDIVMTYNPATGVYMQGFEPRTTNSGKRISDGNLTAKELKELDIGRKEKPDGLPYVKTENIVVPKTRRVEAAKKALARVGKDFKSAPPLLRKIMSKEGTVLKLEGLGPVVGVSIKALDKDLRDEPNSKVALCVKKLKEIYDFHPLACQAVFIERGYKETGDITVTNITGFGRKLQVTRKIKYTVPIYSPVNDLVERLVASGIPREEIAVVKSGQDGTKKKEKEAILADMRTGKKRIVVASTKSMGVGVNIQTNLRALHYIEPSWTIGDHLQSLARAHRQGNKWNTVLVYNYITTGLDGKKFKAQATKDAMVYAAKNADSKIRTIDADTIGGDENPENEGKGSGSMDILNAMTDAIGDARYGLLEQYKSKLKDFSERETLFKQNKQHNKERIKKFETDIIPELEKNIEAYKADKVIYEKHKDEPFSVQVRDLENGKFITFTEKDKADAYIKANFFKAVNTKYADEYVKYLGFNVGVYVSDWYDNNTTKFRTIGNGEYTGVATLASVKQLLGNMENRINKNIKTLEEARVKLGVIKAGQSETSPYSDDVKTLQNKLSAIEKDLKENPIPAPEWFTLKAPKNSFITYKGEKYLVTGYSTSADTYTLLAQDGEGKEQRIPASEAYDGEFPIYTKEELARDPAKEVFDPEDTGTQEEIDVINALIEKRFDTMAVYENAIAVEDMTPKDADYVEEDKETYITANEATQLYEQNEKKYPDLIKDKELGNNVKEAVQETIDFGTQDGDVLEKQSNRASLFDNERQGRKREVSARADKAEKRGKILGLNITRKLVNNGSVSLVGKKANGTQDLAEIAQVLRNPYYEQFSYVYKDKDNNVVFQETTTSFMPSETSIFFEEDLKGNVNDGMLARMKAVAKKVGATTISFVHNHPSGNPKPSQADRRSTVVLADMLSQAGLNFGEHVVLDHTVYTSIDNNGYVTNGNIVDSAPTYDVAELEHPALGQKVKSAEDFASVINTLHANSDNVAIFTDAKLVVRSVQKLHDNLAKKTPEEIRRYVRYCARSVGAGGIFVATHDKASYNKISKALKEDGNVVHEIVLLNDRNDVVKQSRVKNISDDMLGTDSKQHIRIMEETDLYNDEEDTRTAEQKASGGISKQKDASFAEKFQKTYDDFYKHWVDDLHSADLLQREINKRTGKKQSYENDIYKQLSSLRNIPKAHANAMVFGDVTGTPYIDAINAMNKVKMKHNVTVKQIFDKLEDISDSALERSKLETRDEYLSAYLVANRIIELNEVTPKEIEYLKAQGASILKDKKLSLEEKMELVKPIVKQIKALEELKEYSGPKGFTLDVAQEVVDNAPVALKQSANLYYKYTDNLLSLLEDGGIISKSLHKQLTDKYPHYCPMFRDFSDTSASSGDLFAKRGVINVAQILRRISKDGSKRLVLNPLESTLKATYNTIESAEKNKVAKNFVRMSVENGLEEFIQPVKAGTPAVANPQKGIFTVWTNGEKRAYVTTPDIYECLECVDARSADFLWSWLRQSAHLLRVGATSSPGFMVTNMIRDTIFASITTDGFVPFYSSVNGAYKLITDADFRAAFEASGAPMGNFINASTDSARESIKQLRESDPRSVLRESKNPLHLVKAFANYLLEQVESLSKLSEDSTRAGVFLAGIEKGMSIREAGALSKDNVVDFGRGGQYSRSINQIVPFFNATIQGVDKMNRSLKNHPAKTLLLIGLLIVLPKLLLWALNNDKEWYNEVDDAVKDKNLLFRIGSDKQGEGHTVRIPLPQEAGLFGALFERMLNSMKNQEPEVMAGFAKTVVEQMLPSGMPPLLAAYVESWANKNLYTDRPIVGAKEAKLEPSQQYDTLTTELSKYLAKALNSTPLTSVTGEFSPKKIDNTIRATTGSAGTFVAESLNPVLGNNKSLPAKDVTEYPALRRFFSPDNVGSKSVSRFYDMTERVANHHATYGIKGRPDRLTRGVSKDKEAMSRLNKEYHRVLESEKLSPSERRNKIDSIRAKKVKLAQDSLRKYYKASKF